MQVPIRKGDKIPRPKSDPFMTAAKFAELKAKVQKWKTLNRPREAAEVARLALMGDFSENVGYQVAKGRLRGLNQRILDTEDLLARAEIIAPSATGDKIKLGHRVTIKKINPDGTGQEQTYRILGAAETDPTAGVISHSSPLGAALLGQAVGKTIDLNLNGTINKYRIERID